MVTETRSDLCFQNFQIIGENLGTLGKRYSSLAEKRSSHRAFENSLHAGYEE